MEPRIRIHRESLENRKRQLQHWQCPTSVKEDLLSFLDDLGLGKVNRGRKLPPERQLHYLNGLRVPLEFFNKPTRKLALRDVEAFEKALSGGRLRNKSTGQPYAHNTQVEMRKLLRIFLRWRLGGARALALTDWLDTRPRSKTPDFLKEAEIERLYRHCRNARQRFLIAVLFDSGARAEEFHNLRFEDVRLPEGKENFVKITLKQEYSKTLGRTIALYWKHSLEAFQEYLVDRIAQGLEPTDPVFKGDYTATRKFLQRLGHGVLKRPIYYHLFRHSSATYYATKLNRQELCYRYGWRFSSDMPDVYISRSGMESKELDAKFTNVELGSLKDELACLQQQNKIKDERLAALQGTIDEMRRNLATLTEVLARDPTVAEVERALLRKRE
jgi:integrase